MNSFKEIAYKILKQSDKAMRAKEITAAALKNGLKTEGKTPELTMSAQLIMDIKNKGKLSDFKKAGPGLFAINDEKEILVTETKPDRILEELEYEEEQEVEGGYIGKAGEHAVLTELLFRGFNASLMSVDVGIDVVAIKDSKTFNIQVKTRNISKTHNAFFFNLRIASFERHNSGGTFYIFVLRENSKLDYLILPLSEIEKSIEQEFIHTVGRGKIYRITVRINTNKIYVGRKDNDVSYYLNRWEGLK